MNEALQLKSQALDIRQDIDHLVTFYRRFQAYVERLAAVIAGQAEWDQTLQREQTALDVAFEREHGHRFLEWESGEQQYRGSVYDLIKEPGGYRNRPDVFAYDVQDAAVTFEQLFDTKERELRNLHEHIALLDGEQEARRVTTIEPAELTPPAATPAQHAEPEGETADARAEWLEGVADKVYRWGGRAIQFGLWACTTLQLFGFPVP